MTLESPKIPPQIIVDAHQKIALQALYEGFDYLRHPLALGHKPSAAGLPDALLGRIAVIFSAVVTIQRPKNQHTALVMHYHHPKEAYEAALRQWDYYQRLADKTNQVWLVQTAADLHQVLETWQPDTPLNRRRQGLVLTLSGADPILEPRQFEEWYARGVRCVGLAYASTRYSGSSAERSEGLTKQGHELLDVLADYQTIVDVARISERGLYQVLDRYDGPLLVSHGYLESKDLDDNFDAVSRSAVCRLAERDGVVALRLLHWPSSARPHNQRPPLRAVAEMVDTVCQWTGSSAHVAIGSDLASPQSLEDAPLDVDTTGDLWKLYRLLDSYGFSAADVQAIMAGNLLRLLRRALP
ncbi:MAG: membrane dipeptidase [Anaerolineae bacterium]